MMSVRQLNKNDAFRYRYFRLNALKNEACIMGDTYTQEEALPFSHWENECDNSDNRCLFGLFDKARLVGILMAKRHDQDSTGQTAYWGYAYLHPNYRGNGQGKPLYKLREEWTIEKGFTRAVFNFGKQNKRSMEIHKSRGARFTHTQYVKNSKGNVEPWYWFEVDIPTSKKPERQFDPKHNTRPALALGSY